MNGGSSTLAVVLVSQVEVEGVASLKGVSRSAFVLTVLLIVFAGACSPSLLAGVSVYAQTSNDLVAPVCVLQFTLINSLIPQVALRLANNRFHFGFLDLTEFGFVLADFGRVSLARMAGCPGVTACGGETGRLDFVSVLFNLFLLVEGNKETAGRACWHGLRTTNIVSSVPCRFLLFSVSNLLHFRLQVSLLLVAEQQREIVVLPFVLLREIKFFLVAGCVVETKMLWNGAFASARDHRQGRAKLSVKVVFQRYNHFLYLF